MTEVFADTLYWVAVAVPRDEWHSAALTARRGLGSVRLVTTDEVLSEFFASLSATGPSGRIAAVTFVHALLGRDDVIVLPQSRQTFQEGMRLYERRPDKSYSLTDCISMNTMRSRGIAQILTNDHHFAQEGFNTLVRN